MPGMYSIVVQLARFQILKEFFRSKLIGASTDVSMHEVEMGFHFRDFAKPDKVFHKQTDHSKKFRSSILIICYNVVQLFNVNSEKSTDLIDSNITGFGMIILPGFLLYFKTFLKTCARKLFICPRLPLWHNLFFWFSL